jgi:transcriptional regulator with XRE-family HTH domain
MAQEALVFASGISTGAIARIELGQASPAWVTIRALANALDISLSALATAVEAGREQQTRGIPNIPRNGR